MRVTCAGSVAAISAGTGAGKSAATAFSVDRSVPGASVPPAGASRVMYQYTSPWPIALKPTRDPADHTSHPMPSNSGGSVYGTTARYDVCPE